MLVRLKALPPVRSVEAARRAAWSYLLWIGLFSLVMNLLMLTGPLFMLQVYDRVLPSSSVPTLVVLTGLVLFLFALFGLLDFVRSRLLSRLGVYIVQRLKGRMVDGVVRLAVQTGGASMAMRPLRDLEVIKSYYSGPAFAFWFDVPGVPLYLAAIFLMHPWLGMYALACIVILVPLALLFHRRAQRPLEDVEKAQQRLQAVASDTVAGAASIQAMGMGAAVEQRWLQSHDSGLLRDMTARDRTATLGAVTRPLRLAMQSLVLAVGAYLVILGEISAGAMIAASIILGRALQPVDQFIAQLRIRGQFRDARRRINDFLSRLPDTPRQRTAPLDRPDGPLEVILARVLPPGRHKPVLVNVRFVARPGRIIAIAGPNGVGKSSLLHMLAGIWPVPDNAGRITLDGAELTQWPAGELGRHIGFVEQNVVLMDGSVRDNISRLEPEASAEAVRAVAERAGVAEMIRAMGGYDVEVGPRGALLSAGQRQQVALARALYTDPHLLLLDEPFTSLDHEAQTRLAQSLTRLRAAGKIVIFTDHGNMAQQIADDLLVLAYGPQGVGEAVAFGPAREVLAKAGGIARRAVPPTGGTARNGGGQRDSWLSGMSITTGAAMPGVGSGEDE